MCALPSLSFANYNREKIARAPTTLTLLGKSESLIGGSLPAEQNSAGNDACHPKLT